MPRWTQKLGERLRGSSPRPLNYRKDATLGETDQQPSSTALNLDQKRSGDESAFAAAAPSTITSEHALLHPEDAGTPVGSALPHQGDGINAGDTLRTVRLESFTSKPAPKDSALGRAQDNLQVATEELESVLCQISEKSSTRMVRLRDDLKAKAAANEKTSLPSLADVTQKDQETHESTTGAKAGRYLTNLYPVLRLVLGIAGSAATDAGFMPAQVAANGLTNVLDLAAMPGEQTDKVKKGLDTLSKDQGFLRKLQMLPVASIDESLLICATELQTALMVFLKVGILWLKHNAFVKFVNCAVQGSDVDSAVEALTTARSALLTTIAGEEYFLAKWRDIRRVIVYWCLQCTS